MKFGGSAWGNPDEVAKTFNCTINGLEVATAMRSDFPLIINEKQLADYYQKALSAIKDDILKLYGTFAKDNDLDFSEAKKLLNGNEFKTWRLVCCSSSALQVNRFAFHLR